jgi:maltose O-acetyltransferase
VIAERTRASAQAEAVSERRSLRLLVIRTLNFVTNYLVRHIPSFALRRAWYRRVLGVQMGHHAGVHLGCYLWFYGPGQLRRSGCRIGDYSRINRNCTLDARGPLHIGANVSISPEVVILTAAHRMDDPSFAV